MGDAPISEILEGGVPMMAEIDTAILIGSISDISELEYLKDIIDARIAYLYKCSGGVVKLLDMEPEE